MRSMANGGMSDLSDQSFLVELMISEIAQRVVQQDAVNENDATNEIAFLSVGAHQDHGRF